jgi:Holliday junction resolvase RusA-like endonuclease
MTVTFTVPGNPVPQPRARVTVRGNHPHGYTPPEHPIHAYRDAIAVAGRAAGLCNKNLPLVIEIVAVFKRPKSHFNKSGLKATAPVLPRPDVDNVAKGVLDALKSVVGDDMMVARLVVDKWWGVEGRTVVTCGVREPITDMPRDAPRCG